MLTWCKNTLEIRGPKSLLDSCVETIAGANGILDFNKIIPKPEKFTLTYQNNTPVEIIQKWGKEHWGTKWNANNPKLYWTKFRSAPAICIEFETVDNIPVHVLHKLASLFPKLRFILQSSKNFGLINLREVYFGGSLIKRTVRFD